MTTLGKDKYDHGVTVGTEKGIRIGTINTAVECVLVYIEDTGRSVDEALSRFPIPEEYRSEVESEVRRRLSQN